MLKVTCALIIRNKKLLITQNNSDSDHPFLWEFPGGKIKYRETAENCIQREIQEELAIEIDILSKIIPIEYDYEIKQIELIPFICSIKSGTIILSEHLAYQWIGINDLNQIDFSEADKKLINQQENFELLKKYLRK